MVEMFRFEVIEAMELTHTSPTAARTSEGMPDKGKNGDCCLCGIAKALLRANPWLIG
jgi:hypothetical protein